MNLYPVVGWVTSKETRRITEFGEVDPQGSNPKRENGGYFRVGHTTATRKSGRSRAVPN